MPYRVTGGVPYNYTSRPTCPLVPVVSYRLLVASYKPTCNVLFTIVASHIDCWWFPYRPTSNATKSIKAKYRTAFRAGLLVMPCRLLEAAVYQMPVKNRNKLIVLNRTRPLIGIS